MVIQALLLQTARIIYTFYKHRKELHEYLGSSDERISPSHFLRMLALGCFDMIITLPIQLVALVTSALNQLPFQFYNGWSYLHSDWEPALFSKESWSMEKLTIFLVHWDEWLYPFFALVFFALFGLSPEAKEGYRRFFRSLGGPLGSKQAASTDVVSSAVIFKSRKCEDMTYTSDISSM